MLLNHRELNEKAVVSDPRLVFFLFLFIEIDFLSDWTIVGDSVISGQILGGYNGRLI